MNLQQTEQENLSPATAAAEESAALAVESLRAGDRVDMRSCPFLNAHASAEFEYAVVESVERETSNCVAVAYEDLDVVGYQVGTMLLVDPETLKTRKPQCFFCEQTPVAEMPQSSDQGTTVKMILCCVDHRAGWWDGADWDGQHLEVNLGPRGKIPQGEPWEAAVPGDIPEHSKLSYVELSCAEKGVVGKAMLCLDTGRVFNVQPVGDQLPSGLDQASEIRQPSSGQTATIKSDGGGRFQLTTLAELSGFRGHVPAQELPETNKPPLALLQDVVAAQLRLWAAMTALEEAIAPGGEYSDSANDESIAYFKSLAVGLDAPEEAYVHVNDEHLQKVLQLARQ